MIDYYLWLKAFHIIAVICWMAGLLYLPRLFVYHANTKPGSEISETFLTMERRLLKIIMNPAMILTFVLGFTLIFMPGGLGLSEGWLHAKLLLVFLLAALHGAMSRWYKEFQNNERKRTSRFFRIANEIPTVIMILVILLVTLKPF